MDILRELFGTYSGWLIVVIMVVMAGIPVAIRRMLQNPGVSPAEQMERQARTKRQAA
jgi:TRAP-type mannitol/chloroaromatic compound transport system permease small subunit